MGEDGEDTLTSTNISVADWKKYGVVIGQFDLFFKVRKNVILEWANFNCRCQGHNETEEQFITCLYRLAENSEYCKLKDQMIHNHIVVGVRDLSLSVHLQMDSELTVVKVQMLVRQHEAVQTQQSLLQHGQKVDTLIDFLRNAPPIKRIGSQRG